MKNLVLAAVAATMIPAVSSAGDLEVSNACIVGHGVSTLHDGREVVDLDSVNEMIACMVAEEAEKTAKEADRVVTYIAAWEEAKAKVIELIYEIAVLEQKLDDVDYGQNAQIQELAQYNADIKAELLKTATRMLEAESALEELQNAPNASAEALAATQDVIGKYNSNDAKRFANDPDGLVNDVYVYLIDRLADLKRAEKRIRQLEEQIQWHKDGGYWNPSHW